MDTLEFNQTDLNYLASALAVAIEARSSDVVAASKVVAWQRIQEQIQRSVNAPQPQRVTRRCSMCDAYYTLDDVALHAHVLPQSGSLRLRWLASGLPWNEFHDVDLEARRWGHRDALS